MEDQSFNYDEEKALRKNTYTKEGYTFAGWTYNEGTLSDEQEVSNLTTEDNAVVTLTSKFDIKKYRVVFMNESNIYNELSDVNYGSYIESPSTNPSKEHYHFVGWKLNGEDNLFAFNERQVNDSIAVNRIVTLVSVYEEIEGPVISVDPEEWTNNKVSVTLSNSNNYDMMIKVGENNYTEYNEPIDVIENTTVRGKNIIGSEESVETIRTIDNIDKENPSIGEETKTSVYVPIYR